MGPDEITAARERCEAATPGPWLVSPPEEVVTRGGVFLDDPRQTIIHEAPACWEGPHVEADATFIAHARADLPAALDALEEAREDLERAKALIRDAEWAAQAYDAGDACPWCPAVTGPGGPPDHAPGCPARWVFDEDVTP